MQETMQLQERRVVQRATNKYIQMYKKNEQFEFAASSDSGVCFLSFGSIHPNEVVMSVQ